MRPPLHILLLMTALLTGCGAGMTPRQAAAPTATVAEAPSAIAAQAGTAMVATAQPTRTAITPTVTEEPTPRPEPTASAQPTALASAPEDGEQPRVIALIDALDLLLPMPRGTSDELDTKIAALASELEALAARGAGPTPSEDLAEAHARYTDALALVRQAAATLQNIASLPDTLRIEAHQQLLDARAVLAELPPKLFEAPDDAPAASSAPTATPAASQPNEPLASGIAYATEEGQFIISLANGAVRPYDGPPPDAVWLPDGSAVWVDAGPVEFEVPQVFAIRRAAPPMAEPETLLTDQTFYDSVNAPSSYQYVNSAPRNLVLSSDGARLLFWTSGCCSPAHGHGASIALDLQSREVQVIQWWGDGSGAWLAPDGQRAIWNSIEAMPEMGFQVLASYGQLGGERAARLEAAVTDVVWLADGRMVYATAPDGLDDGTIVPGQLRLAQSDGATIQVIAEIPSIAALALSPDQRSVAYVVAETGELWVTAINEPQPRSLATLGKGIARLGWR